MILPFTEVGKWCAGRQGMCDASRNDECHKGDRLNAEVV